MRQNHTHRIVNIGLLMAWLLMMFCVATPAAIAAGATAPSQPASAPLSASERASYGAMADVLSNDTTRQRMVEQLRALADGKSPADVGLRGASSSSDDDKGSLPNQIATTTERLASQIGDQLLQAGQAINDLLHGRGAASMTFSDWKGLMSGVILVLVVTQIVFWILRLIAAPFYRRVNNWVNRQMIEDRLQRESNPPDSDDQNEAADSASDTAVSATTPSAAVIGKRIVAVGGSFIIDLLLVAIAVAVGSGVGMFGIGTAGEQGTFVPEYLSAFGMIELTKAVLRLIFATRYDHLRLFPMMTTETARYWNRWLARLVGMSGYGLLVAIPIISHLTGSAMGVLASLIIMIAVYVYAVRVIVRNRVILRDRFNAMADDISINFFSTLLRALARTWHIFAILYFTVLLVVSQVEPTHALPFMAAATLQTLVAIGGGLLISAVLTALMQRRVRLPAGIHRALPLLEPRLNAYVPKALHLARILISILVVLMVLDAWHAFNLSAWLTSAEGARMIGTLIDVSLVLFIAMMAWTLIASIIEHRLSNSNGYEASAREKTLLSLFRNAIMIVIVSLTLLVVLSQLGINITPILTSVGVLGLAVSFGAQTLVKDIITGIFIQLENALNTGDVVDVAGINGTVERVTIRSVAIRATNGAYHVIPFSSVDKVTNYMRGFARHVGEYGIAYREDIDNAIAELQKAFEKLNNDDSVSSFIIGSMEVPGVIALADSAVVIRIMITTLPGKQWAVGRLFNKLVKNQFDEAGIEMPYPHQTLYFGEDRDGNAPAANVRLVNGPDRSETSTPEADAPSSEVKSDAAPKAETVFESSADKPPRAQ